MNDKTRIRIKVPAHLYESVKKQLTLKEGKQNFGAGFTVVKEKKVVGEPKVEGSAPSSKSPVSKAPSSKAPAMATESSEKTVEERLTALEELINSLKKKKDSKDEGLEDEIGYEAGQQNPGGKEDVSMVDEKKNRSDRAKKIVYEGQEFESQTALARYLNKSKAYITKLIKNSKF